MKSIRLYTVFFLLISGGVNFSSAQKIYYVGIPNAKMNYYASYQQKPQWCWAASIQMVLKYYGVNLSQKQIVRRTYGQTNGELPDWAASIETIHKNLNHKGVDLDGRHYIVNAQVGMGAPDPMLLISELSHKRPIVIGYHADIGGHVVLITAVSYYESNRGPIIRTIVVRDPSPDTENHFMEGRVEFDGATLAKLIDAYWLVRVYCDSDSD